MLNLSIKKNLANFELDVQLQSNSLPLAIFGPSGAGKSTILKSIAGLVTPDSGKISLGDTTFFDSDKKINLPCDKRAIGYLPQNGALFPHVTVEENMLYGKKRNRGRPVQISLDEVCNILEIEQLLQRQPTTLSGGERQRVSLGRALLTSPRLLLFDEPLAAIENRLKRRILPYIIRAVEHFQIPTIYVSHGHEEVIQIARQILVLNNGKAVAAGPYLDIIDEPAVYESFSREGVVNAFSGIVQKTEANTGYTEILTGRTKFRIPHIEQIAGSDISVMIKANDIILSTEKPNRISTRNILSGKVTRVANVGPLYLVHLDVGCELLIELTASAIRELTIEENQQLWALIKTSSFTVFRTS